MQSLIRPTITVQERLFNLLLMITGLGLAQSTVIGGLNASIADFGFLGLFLMLIYQHRLKIPLILATFFLLIFIVRGVVSIWYLPLLSPLMTQDLIGSILKYSVIALYFLVGFSLAQLKSSVVANLLHYFIWANVAVGVFGIILVLLNLSSVLPQFFIDFRYLGLMNDPNYFSMLQVMSIPLTSHYYRHQPRLRRSIIGILLISTLLSGSKSSMFGLVSLLVLNTAILVVKSFHQRHNVKLLIMLLTRLLAGLLIYRWYKQVLVGIAIFGQQNPSFERLTSLFDSDPLSSNGSERTSAWSHAISLLDSTNGLGIGFNDYSQVARLFVGSTTIAHNTFLQIAVEWGLIFSLIFFSYLVWQLLRGLSHQQPFVLSLTISLTICLIYFFSISLNNSRIFWLLFGIWIVYLKPTQLKGDRDENFSHYGYTQR